MHDHRVFGTVVLPATAYLEMALAAGAEVVGSDRLVLEDVVIEQALVLPDDGHHQLQLVLTPEISETYSFQIFSRSDARSVTKCAWRRHATGRLFAADPDQLPGLPNGPAVAALPADVDSSRASAGGALAADLYLRCRRRGIDYGPSFRALESVYVQGDCALGRIRLPETLRHSATRHKLHPALLDAGFQVLGAVTSSDGDDEEVYVPVAIDRVQLFRATAAELWSRARVRAVDEVVRKSVIADLQLLTPGGQAVASIVGLQLKAASREVMLRTTQASLQDWLYEPEWRKQEHAADGRPIALEGQRWLVLADRSGSGRELAARLESAGAVCTIAAPGEDYERLSEREYRVDPGSAEHFSRLVGEIGHDKRFALCGVVMMWGVGAPDASRLTTHELERTALSRCSGVLYVVQSIVDAASTPPRLWLVTRGAQPVAAAPDGHTRDGAASRFLAGISLSPLWGLGRVIALEHPDLKCVRVDLDPDDEDVQSLFEEITAGGREDQVAFRNGERYVMRLVWCHDARWDSGARQDDRPRRDPNGVYLITGGLGGLGLVVARWLVETGARRLVLAGRGAPSAAARGQIAELKDAGADVGVALVDVSDPQEVARLLDGIESHGAPLRGIVHCAGVLDDGVLLQQTPDRFRRVLAPKVLGAWNLHTLTRDRPLDVFALFSSAASLLGSPGQANYSAANAFLDALASYRRSRGLPAVSINWGPWAEVGQAARRGLRERFQAIGLETIAVRQGLQILELLIGSGPAQVAVLPIHWQAFSRQLQAATSPFLSELLSPAETRRPDPRDRAGFRRARWAGYPPQSVRPAWSP